MPHPRGCQIVESEQGGLAVHCKAGLGRTGTLISLYLMKWYGVTTPEVISWLRLCRPGSVIGPQQNFLAEMESRMHAEGDRHRKMMAQQKAQGGGDGGAEGMSSAMDNCSVSANASSALRGNGGPPSPNPMRGKSGFGVANAPAAARGAPTSPTRGNSSPLKKAGGLFPGKR